MIGTSSFGRPTQWGAPLLALALVASLAGCESLLDVDNPNNVPAEGIRRTTAAAFLVNGVHSSLARGVNAVNLPAATAADELDWVGSRDAWRQLEFGNLSDPFNEFTDAAFPFLGEARWFADEAIEVLEEHRAAGRLVPGSVDPLLLARAYVYGGVAYLTIADLFDRWAFSDREVSAQPLAPNEMHQVYDKAILYLNRADSIAQAIGSSAASWRLYAVALRARARHARAVWNMIGPVPDGPISITNQGLTSDAAALADAQLALTLNSTDWKFVLRYSATTVGGDFGAWVNNRQEMRLGDVYVYPSTSNLTWDSTRINDPITGTRDPVLNATATAFKAAALYPEFTVISGREARLIQAEVSLAAADTAAFTTSINALRSLNGLPAYDPANAAHPRPREMLIYSRQVSLYLQGRRLADMYRFGIQDAKWLPSSEAVTQPGRFLPITAAECLSNTFIGAANCRL
jgi:hypothetical protein